MSDTPLDTPARPSSLDPRRHPAALSNAIAQAWRPYRWRAYAAGVLAGLVAGGVAAPIATTSLLLVFYFAGSSSLDNVTWPEGVWSAVFALTVPLAGATAFARWQPSRLRMAAQTYIWLATRAEANWARVFGARPIPRDEAGTRAALASIPETPETASERFGLWIALLELDRARAALAEVQESTAFDRFGRASAEWLLDFVAGVTRPLEPIEGLVDAIDEPDQRLEAVVGVAVDRARVELSEGKDWQAPLASVRDRLGTAPDGPYTRLLWRPVFRTLLISSATGVIVFWLAVMVLEPYFSILAR